MQRSCRMIQNAGNREDPKSQSSGGPRNIRQGGKVASLGNPIFRRPKSRERGSRKPCFHEKQNKRETLKPENRKAREPEIQGAPVLIRDLPMRERLADSMGRGPGRGAYWRFIAIPPVPPSSRNPGFPVRCKLVSSNSCFRERET